MNKKMLVSGVAGALMLVSAGATRLVTPSTYLSSVRPGLALETTIPHAFGQWREDQERSGAVVNPQTEAALKKIYTQTLSRTYVNRDGERIMLSIAYGGDQRDGMQVHYPEICYPAQGFQLNASTVGELRVGTGTIPVRRLETALYPNRAEPVTYWTMVGDRAVLGGSKKKLAELHYAMAGQIPDGLLFRVSSIDENTARAFKDQEQFINDLLASLSAPARAQLSGLR
ncbi:EpsI family protein [Rugamonas sp. FT107W]|uniref:EpsI family protein n=1 Tax=Duganella vulcania TaxID=2692166 RepID=A0A845HG78_9BURK|nr:exosortase-associated protein EpsI, B-type [Duganella vulcania]MYN17678.1 EpsI family protein [Duganella vulcania]